MPTDPVEFERCGGRRLLLAVISALVAAPTAAGAVECGEVLTEDTVLEADLTCPGDGLVVGVDGILIDLGGHLLRGSNVPGTAGIRNEGRHHVEIRNGRIEHFERGIDLAGVTGNRIEGLILGEGIGFYNDVGIALVESNQNHIRGNQTYWSEGIVLIDSQRNRIEGNHSLWGEWYQGILLRRSDHNEVIDNYVLNQSTGILLEHADHNLVEGNGSHSNFEDGIALFESHDNRVIGNSAGSEDGEGIQLWNSNRNLIAGNGVSHGEGGASFAVASSHYNRIESNFIEGNFWSDAVVLSASDHNEVTGNTVVGSIRRTRGYCDSGPLFGIHLIAGVGNRLTGNAVAEHCFDGIRVERSSRETRLLRNLAYDNRDDGFDIEDSTAQIVGNTALGNGDYGIEGVPGVRGGGNRASGNGNPEQCLEIACK